MPAYATGVPGLYPLPGGNVSPITPEPLDVAVARVPATGLAVRELGRRNHVLIGFRRISADVLITDQRVAVACCALPKGRDRLSLALRGAPAVDGEVNAAATMRVARRSRGRVLVGHVRYQWLTAVGFQARYGRFRAQRVRLALTDGSEGRERPLAVDIELEPDVRAAEIAQHIVWRASRFLLAHVAVAEDHRSALEELRDADPLVERGAKTFTSYQLPFALPAARDTALVPDAGISDRCERR